MLLAWCLLQLAHVIFGENGYSLQPITRCVSNALLLSHVTASVHLCLANAAMENCLSLSITRVFVLYVCIGQHAVAQLNRRSVLQGRQPGTGWVVAWHALCNCNNAVIDYSSAHNCS
jgi:hypothetical protein